MEKLEPRPYKIIGKIQHYEWGTKNNKAFIPKFLGIEPDKDLPYAEYWIGVHAKAPSEILVNNEKISLIELLEKFPSQILGKRISKKFKNTLPFLLKVLSIEKALSIQAHPNKVLAKKLHENSPENYPDDNHKPEIAIAIDNLKAIVGLKSYDGIISELTKNPELEKLISIDLIANLKNDIIKNKDEFIKELYSAIMNSPKVKLEECILSLVNKFSKQKVLTEAENQFLIQYKNYGIDVGLISLLLFNMIELQNGESLFTPAGIPHAYIKGNIIECMANSDNVVRAGLTPKFKDIKTLTEMLVLDNSESKVNLIEDKDKLIYKTTAEEFEICKLKLNQPFTISNNNDLCILLIMEGNILINWGNSESETFKKGEAVLIPANLNKFSIVTKSISIVYKVTVP